MQWKRARLARSVDANITDCYQYKLTYVVLFKCNLLATRVDNKAKHNGFA